MTKRRALIALQIFFYAAILVFMGRRFSQLTGSVSLTTLSERPLSVGLSVSCFIIFYGLLAMHWQIICHKFATRHLPGQWLAFFASQPYKYLPSSLFTFSSRAIYAKKLGLSIKRSSVAQVVENASMLSSGLAVAVLFFAFQTSAIVGSVTGILAVVALGALTLLPQLKLPKTAYALSGRQLAGLFLLAAWAWLFAGAALHQLLVAIGEPISFVSAVAVNSVAIGLGILVIIAPGGIGVRELVYDKFDIGSSGIVLWRLLTLTVDIVVGTIAIYMIAHTTKAGIRSIDDKIPGHNDYTT